LQPGKTRAIVAELLARDVRASVETVREKITQARLPGRHL